MLLRLAAFATALAILVSTAIVQGEWSGRWTIGAAIERAVTKLDAIPIQVGSWSGQAFELDEQSLAIGEIAGYVARRYRHEDGREVSVMLVCGRPGPISVHTPEWCYGGAGFEAKQTPSNRALEPDSEPAGKADFATNLFMKEDAAIPEGLRIYWAWNTGMGWKAPENPRLMFAAKPFLYKLYIVTGADGTVERAGEDVCEKFLLDFLPVVDEVLYRGEIRTASS